MKILFLNHKIQQCGVYQYGLRLYNILKKTSNIEYIYIEIENIYEYISVIQQSTDIQAILYNYHNSTMSWLNKDNIQNKVKNIGIPHESRHNFFDVICEIDPTHIKTENIYPIPRPMFDDVDEILKSYTPSTPNIRGFIEYSEENVPVFGSFGFGFTNKGFDKIVKIVNEQYSKAIIKFVIPLPAFRDGSYSYGMEQILTKCIEYNTNKLKILVTYDFFTNEDLLYFLKSNTMNIFLYDLMPDRGISSVIDYALSVDTPIGISDSHMFRHIYSDDICLYKTSIHDCIHRFTPLKNSIRPADEFSSKLPGTDLNPHPYGVLHTNLHWYKNIPKQTNQNIIDVFSQIFVEQL
jgi:hypothetical protein